MAIAKSGTLTANTVKTETVSTDYQGIVVVNRDQTGEIWVRIDGTDPTVGGADCFVVLGARQFATEGSGSITVKMISTSAIRYTVEGGS